MNAAFFQLEKPHFFDSFCIFLKTNKQLNSMSEIEWVHKKFEEFSLDEFYRLAALRESVFVVEQECAYQELDYKDFEAIHLTGYIEGQPVAYCRIYNPEDKKIRVGRVLVHKDKRGKQVAYELMHKTHDIISQNYKKIRTIVISAQKYLQPFYHKLGYKVKGAEYLEDGIPHVEMHKQI